MAVGDDKTGPPVAVPTPTANSNQITFDPAGGNQTQSPTKLMPTSHAAAEVDKRLANAANTLEFAQYAQLRGVILQQDDEIEERRHRRTREKHQDTRKTIGGGLALAGGVGLAIAGFGLPAFFLIGAGVATFAPRYAREFMKHFGGRKPEGRDDNE